MEEKQFTSLNTYTFFKLVFSSGYLDVNEIFKLARICKASYNASKSDEVCRMLTNKYGFSSKNTRSEDVHPRLVNTVYHAVSLGKYRAKLNREINNIPDQNVLRTTCDTFFDYLYTYACVTLAGVGVSATTECVGCCSAFCVGTCFNAECCSVTPSCPQTCYSTNACFPTLFPGCFSTTGGSCCVTSTGCCKCASIAKMGCTTMTCAGHGIIWAAGPAACCVTLTCTLGAHLIKESKCYKTCTSETINTLKKYVNKHARAVTKHGIFPEDTRTPEQIRMEHEELHFNPERATPNERTSLMGAPKRIQMGNIQ